MWLSVVSNVPLQKDNEYSGCVKYKKFINSWATSSLHRRTYHLWTVVQICESFYYVLAVTLWREPFLFVFWRYSVRNLARTQTTLVISWFLSATRVQFLGGRGAVYLKLGHEYFLWHSVQRVVLYLPLFRRDRLNYWQRV